MKQSKLMWVSLASTLAIVITIAMLATMFMSASAQDGGDADATPNPDGDTPVVDVATFYAVEAEYQGDAEWELADSYYESRYPDGFYFSAQITSTGGEIVNASVTWSHTPGRQRREAAVYDAETDMVTVEWLPAEATAPWVAVNYRWSFEDESGNIFITEWYLGDEYEDNTRNWTRTESDDVIVFAEEGLPDDMGEQTAMAMEAQRETFRTAWGGLLPYKPRAILFSNRASWNQWQIGTTNPRVIGLTIDRFGAIVQVVSRGNTSDLAWGTVPHEVGHLYQDAFGGAFFTGGSWWTEGNATFFELSQQYDYEQRVRNIAASGSFPAMLDGTGPNPSGTGPDGSGRWGYDAGYTFFKWFIEKFGLEAHQEIVAAGKSGMTRNQALEEVTGQSVAELEREFRIWIGAPAEAPTLFPTPTFRSIPTQGPYQSPTPPSE